MRISKYDLCGSCRKIRPRMNDGSLGDPLEEFLEYPTYSTMPDMMNKGLLFYLENDGGCSSCISMVRRAL